MSNVGLTIVSAFHQARALYPQVNGAWKKISISVGSRIPKSLLRTSIQRDGEADLVIRCMEDELAKTEDDLFIGHYLNILSTYWIGSMYETFRLLRERNLIDNNDLFGSIFADLELLRITLEKHEIAKDKNLKAPLQMIRHPPNNDTTDHYTYDVSDNRRGHIMPMGCSLRGSMIWQVMDVKKNETRWVERRMVSDQILELWNGSNTEQELTDATFQAFGANSDAE